MIITFFDELFSLVLLSHILSHNNLAMPLPDIEHRLRTTIASEHLADNMSDIYDILRSVGMVDRSLIQAGVYIL